jgi:hypothetical protein
MVINEADENATCCHRAKGEFSPPDRDRGAERIDVPAGGVVPGPAEIDPLPDRSAVPADAGELAAGWLAWWQALACQLPLREPPSGHVSGRRSPLLSFPE